MFFETQDHREREEYKKLLRIVGSLSNLFSDSGTPYLYYRVAEKIFCKAFAAEDLSRSDVSVDARKGALGLGLKTFLAGTGRTTQKVAEFNKSRSSYIQLEPKALVKRIAGLRNGRIDLTKNAHGLSDVIYHCILREKGKFLVFEEPMQYINIENIHSVKKNKSSISFSDGVSDYIFSLSKSTLLKRFVTKDIVDEFDIKILTNPLDDLERLILDESFNFGSGSNVVQTIFLPLYGRGRKVFGKSGLNQWNAGGRKRNMDEVYIPIPAEIHKNFPNFFPDRDTPFNLRLPDGKVMQSKICQDGNKALMSYSNRELGEWILRQVLNLREGEVLTYKKLQDLGIDSVRVDKMNDGTFEINFSEIGSYERFKSNAR